MAPTLRRHLSTAGVVQVEDGDPAALFDLPPGGDPPPGGDLTPLTLLVLPRSPRRALEVLEEVTSRVGACPDRVTARVLDGVLLELRRDPAPVAYRQVFEVARAHGLHRTARVGPLASAGLVWEALDVLHADRLEHAGCVLDDADLVARLRHDGTPVSLCCTHEQERLPVLLDEGLVVHLEECCDPAAGTEDLIARLGSLDLPSAAFDTLRRNTVKATRTVRSLSCAPPP